MHPICNFAYRSTTRYWYYPDHLGSASWVSDKAGKGIQHLYYLPWGEELDNQRATDYASRYTFSGKERDMETGYGYFGARYYDSDLSIWLSVDPMADKYPSTSPYTYCANNPVRLVDPDGREFKPYDRQSKQYITMYFKQLFGTAKMFRYKDGFLTINERKFNKYYPTATADQQELLNGFKKAIERDEIALIQIQNNPKSYVFYTYKNVYDGDYFMGQVKDRYSEMSDAGGGATSNISNCFSEYYEAPTHLIGVDNSSYNNLDAVSWSPFRKTGVPAATFAHELLDEFLNFYCLKETNTETPQSEKVKFHNTALRILQCIERSGNDHE